MKTAQTIRQPSCRFPSSPRGSRGGESGYVLIVVLFMATLLLVALTAALPNVYTQGRREREEELIFRGTQYARAVALFHRKFNRYPTQVKELLQTNGIRFLRREYKDPITRKGNWRFIHANAAGGLLDSKLRPLPRAGQPGSQGSGSTFGSGSSQGSMLGGSSQGSSFGLPGGPSQGLAGGSLSNPPSDSSDQAGTQSSSSSFFTQGQIQGGFIVGVASTSRKSSIRVWNKRTRYDEWEFLGVDLSALGLAGAGMPQGAAVPGLQGQPGLGGMQPGTPMGPGMPGQPVSPGGLGGPQPPLIQPAPGPGP